jgi:cardiolipin synthase
LVTSSLVQMLEAKLSHLTVGNGVTLNNSGEEKFGRLFEDLEGSRDHIHAEYYIVRDNTSVSSSWSC